jgi:hypothetical protein
MQADDKLRRKDHEVIISGSPKFGKEEIFRLEQKMDKSKESGK